MRPMAIGSFLEHYNIDQDKVYLHGMSGGGETGSLVMGKRPELYTAYLMTSSQWDGDLDVKEESYFTERGFQDQHAGGLAFAHDESIMGWLFGEHRNGTE